MRILIITLPALFLMAATPVLAKVSVMDARSAGLPRSGDFMSLQQSMDRIAPVSPADRNRFSDEWDGYAASMFHPEGPRNVVN